MNPNRRVTEELGAAAPSAFRDDGSLRSLADQVASYEMGELATSEPLVVAARAHTTGLPQVEDLPITIDQSTIERLRARYGLRTTDLNSLDACISEHPLAMDSMSRRDSLIVVVDAVDGSGGHVNVPILVARRADPARYELVVDDVESARWKGDLEFLIADAARAGLTLWVNERTKDWTSCTGLRLPQLASGRFRDEYTFGQVRTQPALDAVAMPPLFPSLVKAGWEPRTMYPGINALPYIVEVGEEMIEALVVAWSGAQESGVEGFDCCEHRYLSQLEGGGALACDNSAGECLVEQFPTTFDAKRWLSDDAISLSDLTQDEMRAAWADLGDVAVDDEGRLEGDWLCYPEGIDREEIWHDFDAAFESGVHALMFPGDHVPSRNPSLSEAADAPRQTDRCAREQRSREWKDEPMRGGRANGHAQDR